MIVIAKEELPIAKSPGLLQLQQKNGIKMSNTSANDTKCAEMVSTVATLIKEEMLLNYKMRQGTFLLSSMVRQRPPAQKVKLFMKDE